MDLQSINNSPKIKRNTKNKIRVDFERTSFWTRFRLKFLTGTAFATGIWWLFRFVLLLGISYIILQPFYSKIASSFMSREDFVDVTVKLIPKHPTLDTYKAIIEEAHYFEAMLNTTILSLLCAFLQTLMCSFIGYGFAKYKFKGSKFFFAMVILTMVIPHKTLRMSLFTKFRYFDIGIGEIGLFNFLGGGMFESFKMIDFTSINMINTYFPLLLLSLGGLGFKNGLFIFMMRQFFRGVPDELEESAYIDGYGPVKTFFRIILPISIPMMITIFLFSFSWQWTDIFYTKVFFNEFGNAPKLLSTIVSIPKQLDINYAGRNLFVSAIRNTFGIMIISPLIVVYLFCQRYLVQGIERSGIVG